MNEPALWAWFLFESGLPALRAKELLGTWYGQELTLKSAISQLPRAAGSLGLSPTEAKRLKPPASLPDVQGLTWLDDRYPSGLNRLPLKLRPALLSCRGEISLLGRPITLLAPGPLAPAQTDDLREVVNLLLGEELLLAAYEGSPQAGLLLEEMAFGQGEGLIFAYAGIDARVPPSAEETPFEERRLLVLSPLPTAPHQTAWDEVLTKVALSAADRIILSGEQAQQPHAVPSPAGKPTLALSATPADARVPDNVQVTSSPADAILWVESLLPGHEESGTQTTDPVSGVEDAHALPEDDLGPAPSVDEILTTLGKGGRVPEALRRRLEGSG